MALVLADRVQETCSAPGTGSATLLGAVSGYQSFSVVGNGNTCYYAIADQAGSNWEVGIGTYSTTGPTLARTTVLASSNANTLVNFASGSQNVFLTYPASKAISTDILASPPAIGATTPNTGAFTTISATGVITSTLATGTSPFSITSTTVVPNLNVSQLLGNTWAIPGTIGSTTPNTGAFTTLSASSTVSGTGFTNLFAAPPAIGGTTPAAGTFTTLSATTRAGVLSTAARTAGSVLGVTGSLTLTTAGTTLASQTAAAGAVWRIRAYGTYAAISSANVRTFTMACFWGTTQLTAITAPAAVLAATAQTTNWNVEFEIATTSTTAAWVTGYLNQNTGVATGVALLTTAATAASTVVTAGAQTLDFRVGQTGTATTDTINVHQVIIERIA